MYHPDHFDEVSDSYHPSTSNRNNFNNRQQRPWSPVNDHRFEHGDIAGAGPGDIEAYLAHNSYQDPRGAWNMYQPQFGAGYSRARQREPSEVSIEALDLADYATTLRRDPAHSNRPQYPYLQQEHQYSAWDNETDTLPLPPSLVTDRTSQSSRTTSSRNPRRQSMPGSFPPSTEYPPSARYAPTNSRKGYAHQDMFSIPTPQPLTNRSRSPFIARPSPDVSDHPNQDWTKPWYNSGPRQNKYNTFQQPTPLRSPPSEFGGTISQQSHAGYMGSPPSSHAELLPWGERHEHDEDEEEGNVPEEVKEERMRMLEREFGGPARNRGRGQGGKSEPVIGSVDDEGNLITGGKKKRSTARWFQGIFALGSAIAGLYGALFIHPKKVPPPSGKIPTYLLYVLSCFTTLLLFYLFAIRPCIVRRRRKKVENVNPAGLTVLPITQSLAGGGKKGKRKKGKKGQQQQDGNAVQVNLIVDPTMFGTQRGDNRRQDDDDASDNDDGRSVPSRRSDQRAGPQRRSVFQGIAMEKAWRAARSWLMKLLLIDILCMILWGGEFVLILMGKRCPSGEFEGWCNAYNTAIACGCLLTLSFAASVFFDTRDLLASKASPRTGT